MRRILLFSWRTFFYTKLTEIFGESSREKYIREEMSHWTRLVFFSRVVNPFKGKSDTTEVSFWWLGEKTKKIVCDHFSWSTLDKQNNKRLHGLDHFSRIFLFLRWWQSDYVSTPPTPKNIYKNIVNKLLLWTKKNPLFFGQRLLSFFILFAHLLLVPFIFFLQSLPFYSGEKKKVVCQLNMWAPRAWRLFSETNFFILVFLPKFLPRR